MRTFWIDPKHCSPPHYVTHPIRLTALMQAIAHAGWNGPPLVGYLNGDKITLLSGSHRFVACLRLGLKVPVEVHDAKEVEAAWGDLWKWNSIMSTKTFISRKFDKLDKAAPDVVG